MVAFTSALLLGCRGDSGPDAIAARFVDAYYLEYDFAKAELLAEGTALMRLKSERALVDDARARVAVADSRTRTYYETPERRQVSPEQVHFRFTLQIRQGVTEIDRVAELLLAERGGAWRVIAFREVNEGVGDDQPGTGVRTETASTAPAGAP